MRLSLEIHWLILILIYLIAFLPAFPPLQNDEQLHLFYTNCLFLLNLYEIV